MKPGEQELIISYSERVNIVYSVVYSETQPVLLKKRNLLARVTDGQRVTH